MPSPSVVNQPCVVAYIDNCVYAGCNRNQVRSDKKSCYLLELYRRALLDPTTIVLNLLPTGETNDALITTALGLDADGDRFELRPKPARVDRACQAIVPIIRGITVTRFLSC